MFTERTSVGVDVRARSVVAAAIDATGELIQSRLTSSPWLSGLPEPVAVAYEAGPTGFGWRGRLARPDQVRGCRAVELFVAPQLECRVSSDMSRSWVAADVRAALARNRCRDTAPRAHTRTVPGHPEGFEKYAPGVDRPQKP